MHGETAGRRREAGGGGGPSKGGGGGGGGGGVAWPEPWRQGRANSGAVASTGPTRQGGAETQPHIRPRPCARAPHRESCSAAGRDNTGNGSGTAGASDGISAPRGILQTMMPPSVDRPPLTRPEGDQVCGVGGRNTNSCTTTPHPGSAECRAKAAGWLADTNRTCPWPDDTREASVCVGLSSRRASHRPRPSLLLMVCPRSTDRRSRGAPPPPSPTTATRLGPRLRALASANRPTRPPSPHPRAPPPLSRGRARGMRRDQRTTSNWPRGHKTQAARGVDEVQPECDREPQILYGGRCRRRGAVLLKRGKTTNPVCHVERRCGAFPHCGIVVHIVGSGQKSPVQRWQVIFI